MSPLVILALCVGAALGNNARRQRRVADDYNYYEDVNKAGVTDQEKLEFVDTHNHHRRNVDPPAASMEKMEWDSGLAEMAQSWADECKYHHGHTTDPADYGFAWHVGQNLVARQVNYSPVRAVDVWADEAEHYGWGTFGGNATCEAGEKCGHYTQVVWDTSYAVGCGITFCPTLEGRSGVDYYNIVCNYYWGGNVNGYEPYLWGEPCSKCPDSVMICDDKLCKYEDYDYNY